MSSLYEIRVVEILYDLRRSFGSVQSLTQCSPRWEPDAGSWYVIRLIGARLDPGCILHSSNLHSAPLQQRQDCEKQRRTCCAVLQVQSSNSNTGGNSCAPEWSHVTPRGDSEQKTRLWTLFNFIRSTSTSHQQLQSALSSRQTKHVKLQSQDS